MSFPMWNYQSHFRAVQQAAAKRVFQSLDSRFDPELFLVGFLARPSRGRDPVCVEPTENFWLSRRDFKDVKLVSALGFAALSAANVDESAVALSFQQEKQLRRMIREGVTSVIAKNAGFPAAMSYSVALPTKVGRYWVCPVLGLQNEVLRSHKGLTAGEVKTHGTGRVRAATSLIDAAALEFLDQVSLELMRPQAGRDLSTIDPDETLRAAGRRLMTGIVWRIDESSIEGLPDLFRAFSTVSSLHYEKAEGRGSIFLARKGHPALETRMEFSASARMKHHNHARKLLELTSTELALHSDSDHIFGLVAPRRDQMTTEDVFEVRIFGHHHWELIHAGRSLMRVKYGQPALPRTRIDHQKLRVDLERIFDGISDEDAQVLISLVAQAVEESHGTMLVISADAAQEAARLTAQCIPVKPRRLTSNLLRHLTPIDGAVLLSPDGMCHAIGTILDGIASANGDPSRGARFNSAVRYVESTKAPCLAVVVSENGAVDYVPDLRPPIPRAEIETRLTALEAFHRSPRVGQHAYVEVLAWFDVHRFYLLEEHCRRLNDIVAAIEARFEAQDTALVNVLRGQYKVHPDMTPHLYYSDANFVPGTATIMQ